MGRGSRIWPGPGRRPEVGRLRASHSGRRARARRHRPGLARRTPGPGPPTGGLAGFKVADASDPQATRSALAKIAEQLGPVDLLIANAGVGESTPARSFSADSFERMVRVNLIGAAHAIEAVLPSMIGRKSGHV